MRGGDDRPLPSDDLLERIADVFKAMGDSTRLRMLLCLRGRELHVNQILDAVGTSQGNVSKQLAVLKEAGIVSRRREANRVYYRVVDDVVFEICRDVCDAIHHDVDRTRETIERARPTLG